MVQGWLIGFATEDESAEPHVQEGPVLNFSQRTIRHMFLDIHLVPNSCFHSSLPGGAFVFLRIHGFCDIKAGHHIYIGQSRRHWSMIEEKSIDTI
jgi:hypothetical protein